MGKTIKVGRRALIQRINRRLEAEGEILKVARGERQRQEVGDYWILDFQKNSIVATNVDLEVLAREVDALQPWECMAK